MVQFLISFRDDFGGLHGTILHCSPLPFVDSIVNELLAEEIRLKSQAHKGIVPIPTPSIFATPQRPPASN